MGDFTSSLSRAAVQRGSVSCRDALRLPEQQEQRLAAALRALRDEVCKGVASGRGKPAEKVPNRLEKKYAAEVQSRRER